MSAQINALKWKCRVIVVSERNDRFGAITVS